MRETLKTYFGYDSFRPLQEEIIRHIMSRQDALVLMPTGGGKSICYQLPALLCEGTAVVVSPLISLMKDQVEALQANGIAAGALNSSNDETENANLRRACIEGRLKLLYISPEKLLAEKDYLLRDMHISLFAIDEAHCISQWGHDFRPEYTQMGMLHQQFPQNHPRRHCPPTASGSPPYLYFFFRPAEHQPDCQTRLSGKRKEQGDSGVYQPTQRRKRDYLLHEPEQNGDRGADVAKTGNPVRSLSCRIVRTETGRDTG